jgi:hypothetical protein
MSFTLDAFRDEEGRVRAHIYPQQHIDIEEFIAAVAQYDFLLISRGIAKGLGIKDWAAPQGAVLS